MRKILFAAIALLGALGVVLVLAGTAPAATTSTATTLACQPGWYVNPDETALLPKQQEDGLLFDGPSLLHHAITPVYKLKDLPVDATFTANVTAGVAPLIKFETSPYSTINKSAAGYWSGKITYANPGGQGNPVATPQELIGKWSGYTDDTTVTSFGIGYANDTGNTALVKSVTFAGHKYSFACAPPTSTTSTSTSASSTSTTKTTTSAPVTTTKSTTVPSTSNVVITSSTSAGAVPVVNDTPRGSVGTQTSGLAYTGAGATPGLVLSIGLALVLIGAGGIAFVTYRRRRRS